MAAQAPCEETAVEAELHSVQRQVVELRQSLRVAEDPVEGTTVMGLPDPELGRLMMDSQGEALQSPPSQSVGLVSAVSPSPRAQSLLAADVNALLTKASELLNRGQLLDDEADAKAHSEAALALFDAALALHPGCIDAQIGRTQATKGVAGGWRSVEATQRRTARHPRRGNIFSGQISFD